MLALVCFVVCAVGCQIGGQGSSDSSSDAYRADVSSSGEMFFLPDEALAEQKALALKGDADAATRVANHYAISTDEKGADLPWLEIAAENGSLIEMRNLAVTLQAKGGEENCRKALGWLKRARRGMTDAEAAEERLDVSIKELEDDISACAKVGSARQ
ncbi:hypothetical protein [Stenotrophomonas sp.]|uniref:hypothetical protein n=1 Tax=Stenotrophomonas sp. TaxID=69392 RepID=UPI0028A1CD63|nr:hypothetical protein [Stenotrophomonas sp.]